MIDGLQLKNRTEQSRAEQIRERQKKHDTDRRNADRTAKGIGILDAAPVYESLPGFVPPEGNLRCCVYSPDGRFFAWASPDVVTVVDASVGHVVTTLPAEHVYELGFSHSGTYIITWQRPSKDENGDAVKNLKVW